MTIDEDQECAVRLLDEIGRLQNLINEFDAELTKCDSERRRLRADKERLKEWCRKLIEAGEFPSR